MARSIARQRDSNELPWQPFSLELLQRLTAERKTVLVDFTADWCLTCKSNEAFALNQPETKKLVEENAVVTLKVDKTQASPEGDELLVRLGNKNQQIPFIAIFPAANPHKPILLDGILSSPKPILEALRQAGPSASST